MWMEAWCMLVHMLVPFPSRGTPPLCPTVPGTLEDWNIQNSCVQTLHEINQRKTMLSEWTCSCRLKILDIYNFIYDQIRFFYKTYTDFVELLWRSADLEQLDHGRNISTTSRQWNNKYIYFIIRNEWKKWEEKWQPQKMNRSLKELLHITKHHPAVHSELRDAIQGASRSRT